MREIKFRFFNNNKSSQYYGMHNLSYEKPSACYYEPDGLFIPYGKFAIIMQYIGLKDKNGKEIYEGDIVKGKFIDKIIFEDARFKLASWEDDISLLVEENCLEVIGNIYENPELLEIPIKK